MDSEQLRQHTYKLYQNLKNHTYCRIKPSSISGVGVFCIKDISSGVNPFKTVWQSQDDSICFSPQTVASLHPGVRAIINDFFMVTETGQYPIAINGINGMDIASYMNHSLTPNIDMVLAADSNDSTFLEFVSNQDIPEGQELTINYYQHCDKDHINKISQQFRLPLPPSPSEIESVISEIERNY